MQPVQIKNDETSIPVNNEDLLLIQLALFEACALPI